MSVISPISPVSVATNYERLSLAAIKQNIERLTRGARIDTPFWGVGGRLWIPLRDVHLEEEFRQALTDHGFTVFDGTKKIGKLGRKNQVGFVVCSPPRRTAPRTKQDVKAGGDRSERRAKDAAKIEEELHIIQASLEAGEEDYERLRKANPKFLTFKVVQQSPILRDRIVTLKDRHGRLRSLARQLAAVLHSVKPGTIKKDCEAMNRRNPRHRSHPA